MHQIASAAGATVAVLSVLSDGKSRAHLSGRRHRAPLTGSAAPEKKELVPKDETTVPARYYVPPTDIFETEDALTVVMELPGVEKQAIDVNVENDVLRVDARLDFTKYEALEPLYTEYNIGHFARSFTLSNKIDQQQISAQLNDGVLTLTLKKAKEALPRQIAIN